MAKKVTLETVSEQVATLTGQVATLAEQMQKGFNAVDTRFDSMEGGMEKGFAAVAEDILDIKQEMASKEQVLYSAHAGKLDRKRAARYATN